jgi:hypothetical protein
MHPGRLALKYQTRVEGTVTTNTLAYSGTELIMTEDIFFDAGTMAQSHYHYTFYGLNL